MAILELYFYDHMKELEIDIVRFIANDINTIIENNNKNLTRIQKISLNDKINTLWNDSNNETFKRINSFSEKSPKRLCIRLSLIIMIPLIACYAMLQMTNLFKFNKKLLKYRNK